MTTADVRDVQTAMIWLAGSLQATTWPLLAVAFLLGAARGHHPVLYRPGGGRGAAGRPDRHRPRRTSAAADGAALFCAGAADLGQRLLRRQPWICGPDGAAYGAFRAARRPVSLLCGSALIGALLVLATDTLGRLAFAPLQIPAGIVIARWAARSSLSCSGVAVMPFNRKVVCVGSSHCCCC